MTTKATTIIAEVSGDLDDQWPEDEYTRWSQDELLEYLNDGQDMIAFFQPTAYTPAMIYQLAAGTRQGLPDGTSAFKDQLGNTHPKAVELIRFTRNMGTNGFIPGPTIHKIDPIVMDEVVPNWRSAKLSSTVVHAMFDQNDRTQFEVYPPQPSVNQGWIETIASAVPAHVVKNTALNDPFDVEITLGDQFRTAIKTYMLYRAFRKDAKSSQLAYRRAIDAWNLFLTLIGRKDLVEKQLPAAARGSNNGSNQ